jgi:ribosomal-protein-alanine N-acetyltransferase
MKIRTMAAGDVDRVVAIAESLAQAPRWPREVYEIAVVPQSRPRRIAVVAEAESGEVAGFAIASAVPPEAELETMGVAPDWQGRGIGKSLLEEVSQIAAGMGVKKVMLEVRVSNGPARRLYRSQGFVEAGRRAGYYADPKEDAIVMCAIAGEASDRCAC